MRQYKVTVDGVVFNVTVEPCEDGFKTEKNMPEIKVASEPLVLGSGEITAPMPGTVLELKCKEGDSVKAGDVILVLEAMKMEIEVTSTASGTLKRLSVSKGTSVNTGDIVAVVD